MFETKLILKTNLYITYVFVLFQGHLRLTLDVEKTAYVTSISYKTHSQIVRQCIYYFFIKLIYDDIVEIEAIKHSERNFLFSFNQSKTHHDCLI